MLRKARHSKKSLSSRRVSLGMGSIEYVVITVLMVSMLLTPFSLPDEEDGNRSVMLRITDAVKREHSGYLYAASIPAWPRGDITVGDNTNGGNGGSGGDNPGGGVIGGVEPPGGGGEPPGGIGGVGGGGTGGGGGIGGPPDIGGSGGGGPGNPVGGLPGGLPLVPGDPPGGPIGGPVTPPGSDPVTPPGGVPGIPPIDPDGPGPGEPIVVGGPPGDDGFPSTPVDDPFCASILGCDDDQNGGGGQCNAQASDSENFTPHNNDPQQRYYGAGQPSQIAAAYVGNPIHVVTGNKYQQEVDLSPLPGGLAFIRHYNSRSRYKGYVGSYETSLRDKGNRLYIWQNDGRRIDFILEREDKQGIRYFRARQHSDGRLIAGDFYTWHWVSGTYLTFSRSGQLHSLTDAQHKTTRFFYNTHNQLTDITDAAQRNIALSYNSEGRIASMTDPAGQITRYQYDALGNLTQATRPDGTARKYHYDDSHDAENLTGLSVIEADGSQIRYATWAYDKHDRAILSTHADGVEKVTLDFRRGQTWVTDSEGQISIYHTKKVNGLGRVDRIDGPGCGSCTIGDTQYDYNEQHQLVSITDRKGDKTHYQYDDQGRTTQVSRQRRGQSAETVVVMAYKDKEKRPYKISRPGIHPQQYQSVEIDYSENDKPTRIKRNGFEPIIDAHGNLIGYSAINRSIHFVYSGNSAQLDPQSGLAEYGSAEMPEGLLIAVDGPREDVEDITRFEYNKQGQLTKLTDPVGRQYQVLAYDDYGRPTALQPPGTAPIKLDYDAAGRIRSIDWNGQGVAYQYDAQGRLTQLTNPLGQTQSLKYDAAGRLIEQSDSHGNTQKLDWDTENRPLSKQTLAAGQDLIGSLRYLYDANGQLSGIENQYGAQASYQYDELGRITGVDTASGEHTQIAYDEAGRPIHVSSPKGQMGYAWHNGKLTQVIDARGNATHYHYDDFGQLIALNSPDTGVTHYAYNAAGQMVSHTNALGQTTTHQYDAAGRRSHTKSPEGQTHYAYHANGRLSDITNPTSTETFDYDDQANLIAHSRILAGQEYTTGYNYHTNGLLKTKTLPDGTQLNHHYYGQKGQPHKHQGRLRAITRAGLIVDDTIVGEINYNSLGQITSLTHGNGITSSYLYDKTTLVGIEHSNGPALYYQYENGRITGIAQVTHTKDERRAGTETGNRTVIPDQVTQYQYDQAGRLIKAESDDQTLTYDYDANGNRTTHSQGDDQKSYSYAPDSNRLLSIDSANNQTGYDYNAAGSPTRIGDTHYSYNSQQRPTEIKKNNQTLAQYKYNSFGERIEKVVYHHAKNKTTKTYFLYDGSQLTAEINDQQQISAQYLYIGHTPIATLRDGQAYHIHADHRGNPQSVTDEDQQTLWQAQSDPFGNTQATGKQHKTNWLTQAQSFELNLRLPGQYYDAETKLHYNYYRDYNPITGRYQTSDPIGLHGGPNTFAYVGGDPVGSVDPLGLSEKSLDEIEEDYRKMIARARNRNWNVAADNLEHFLSVKGGKVNISKEWLLSFNSVQSALETNRKRFETTLLKELARTESCETRTYKDYWDRQFTANPFTELYYASGTSTITSTGEFVISSDNTIQGVVTHRWWDPYDWHAGLGAYIPGSGYVSDEDAIRLIEAGRAAIFDMESIFTQSVTYEPLKGVFTWGDPE